MSKVIKRKYHGQIIQQYDDEYTTLNNYGKRVLDEFIQINYVPYMTKSINKHRTSYGIKHDIERCLKFETEKYKAARKNYVKGKNFFPHEMRNFACG